LKSNHNGRRKGIAFRKIGFNILKEQFEIKPQLFVISDLCKHYWF